MFNTLGMSGGWYLKKKPHTVVELGYHKDEDIDDEDELDTLWFDDQRHFATFRLVKGKSELGKET